MTDNNPLIKNQLLDAIATMLASSGASITDLAAHVEGRAPVTGRRAPVTFAEFSAGFRASLSKDTERTWRTHLSRLEEGTNAQCDCLCDNCLDIAGGCSCECTSCRRTKMAIAAAGDRVIEDDAFPASELKRNVAVSMRMSQKKARHDNIGRAAKRLAPKPEHGHGGAEGCVTAYRSIFRAMVDDNRLTKSPATSLVKPRRQESKRRALSDAELPEFFDTVVTGGDDPELDFYLSWFHIESGARREAAPNLRIVDLQFASQTVKVYEKFGVYRDQPVSVELLEGLLTFARTRGGDLDSLSPVFYYAKRRRAGDPRSARAGEPGGGAWPLTERRYDTLHVRIQQALPWANEISFSTHCLRYTGATVVERIAGSQVARKFLGHGQRNPTDGYTKAGLAEVAKAFSEWTGAPHPLAPSNEPAHGNDPRGDSRAT